LLYRGYIYDHDTGLYYLQSRYYNPTIGRFICADVYAATGQGFVGNNMFAYCLNNPVVLKDQTGSFAFAILGFTIAITAEKLITAIAVVVVTAIVVNPHVQKTIADGVECLTTTVASWIDEDKKAVEEKMAASLATAPKKPEKKTHLHHIVAQTDPRAAHSRWILTELFPCGVGDERNLIRVDAVVHQRLHTNAYYLLVESIIVDAYWSAAPNRQAQEDNVEQALKWIKGFIGTLSALA